MKNRNEISAYWSGRRVQIPAYSDHWMRGDRYGVVDLAGIVAGRAMVRVRLDKSGRHARVWADDCEALS